MLLYVDSQFVSPYAMSAFVSLLEKKLAFEIESVDLAADANQEPAFAATSITRRVPTLIHDGLRRPSHRRSPNTLTKPSPVHVYTLPTRVVAQGRGKYRPGFAVTSCRLEMNDQRSSCSMEQESHHCRRLHVVRPKSCFPPQTPCSTVDLATYSAIGV